MEQETVDYLLGKIAELRDVLEWKLVQLENEFTIHEG